MNALHIAEDLPIMIYNAKKKLTVNFIDKKTPIKIKIHRFADSA